MTSHKIAILSDLHIPNKPSDAAKILKKLLEGFRIEKFTHVWLLGDIFDLMIGNFSFWKDIHRDIFDELEGLAKIGCQVLYFEGNHDFHISQILKDSGLTPLDEIHCLELSVKAQIIRCELAHGDLVNTEDKNYLKWRATTRNKYFRKSINLIPASLAQHSLRLMAEGISRKSRKHSSRSHENEKLKDLYRSYAQERFKNGVQALFLGHCHIPDLFVDATTNAFYLNLGGWLENTKNYAVWEPEKNFLPEVLNASR